MTDDMRADDLRFMPQVRQLIGKEGLSFRNSFSPYPLGCPARASFLTGQFAHNHHVLENDAPFGFAAFDDRRTIATSLHGVGYNTGFVGKYLNSYGAVASRVTGGPSWHYVPPGWTDWYGAVQRPAWIADRYPSGSTYDYFHTIFNINGRTDDSHRGEYQTALLGQFARHLVVKYSRSRRPFFLYMSTLAPHYGAPHEPDDIDVFRHPSGRMFAFLTPARPAWVKGQFDQRVRKSPGLPRHGGPSEGSVRDKPRAYRLPELTPYERHLETLLTRQRAESLMVVDRQVHDLVRTLRRRQELGNTVLVFTSDNGYLLGEHRIRHGKYKAYEPSLRVPLLVAGPGIPHGVRFDPAQTPDLAATIIDLARAHSPHPPDGHSLVPSFTADQGWRTPVLVESLIGGPHYTHNPDKWRRGFHDARTSIGIRTGRWKFIRYSTGETELYDLNHDPNELHSLSHLRVYSQIRAQLTLLWWRYKDCRGRQCTTPLPGSLQLAPAQTKNDTRLQRAGINLRYGVAY